MKMTIDTAKTVHEAIAYAVTICLYVVAEEIPKAEDVNDITKLIFSNYLEKELGITEIGD